MSYNLFFSKTYISSSFETFFKNYFSFSSKKTSEENLKETPLKHFSVLEIFLKRSFERYDVIRNGK